MFNTTKFMKDDLVHRTEIVKVPELKEWFDSIEAPEWTVRGLSHKEISLAEEQANKTNDITKIIQAIAGNGEEKTKAIKKLIGIDDGVPKETAKRMGHLVFGSIDPKIELDTVVKLATHHPVVFANLTNTILKLTGLGSDVVGKHKPSGKDKM